VLPAVDDGPADLDGSRAMLEAALAEGIEVLAATPHVRADHPTTPEVMEAGVESVSGLVDGVRVLPGGELDLERLGQLDDETLRRFGLGGNPRLLLLETPYAGWPISLPQTVFELSVRGFRCVLAHPERNGDVQRNPELLRGAVDAGVAVQLTAASVDGRLGRRAAAASRVLLDAGLAHLLASDAHEASVRAIGMRAAVETLQDRALATWLTEQVPAALLEGAALPPRPSGGRRRFRLPWHR
jgi:protein-tyrosine phosphatase